nr:YihY/virulence factor BrkB family protein [Kofleriaceae bacterium]
MIRLVRRALHWIDTSDNVFARWLRAAQHALLGEMSTLAGGTALFSILATVPTLVAVVAIFSYVSDPNEIHTHLQGLETVLPPAVVAFLQDQLERAAERSQGELSVAAATSLIVALYSARGASSSLIDALNKAYRVREQRGTFPRLFMAIAMAAGALVGVVFMLAVVVALPGLVAMTGLQGYGLVSKLRWPILTTLVLLSAAGIYRFAPSPRPLGTRRHIFSGALIATLLLIALSVGLSEWVNNVAQYELLYGAFGSIIIIVLWFYLAIIALVVGGFVNAELERHAGAPEPERR